MFKPSLLRKQVIAKLFISELVLVCWPLASSCFGTDRQVSDGICIARVWHSIMKGRTAVPKESKWRVKNEIT